MAKRPQARINRPNQPEPKKPKVRRKRIKGRLLSEGDTLKRSRRIKEARSEKIAARKRQVMEDPAEFTKPLALKDILREEESAVRSRFGPEQQRLEQMATNIPAWFEQYKADIASRAQNQQAFMQGLIQGQQTMNQQTAQPSSNSPEAQQAALSRQALGNQGVATMQGQLGAQSQYNTSQLNTADMHKLSAVQQLGQQRGDLNREIGDFRVGFRGDARERERKYGMDAALAESIMDDRLSDNQRQERDARSQARNRRSTQRRLRKKDAFDRRDKLADNRRADEKARRDAAKDQRQRQLGTGPYAPKKGEKPAKNKPTAKDYEGRRSILQARTQYRRHKKNYSKYRADGEKNNVPLPIIHAGYEMEHQKYIGPNTARELREIGIRVPPSWTRRKRSRNKKGARP